MPVITIDDVRMGLAGGIFFLAGTANANQHYLFCLALIVLGIVVMPT